MQARGPALAPPRRGLNIQSLNEAVDWDHHILDGSPSGSFFVGRESELSRIHQSLKGHDGQPGTNRLVLSGLGGIGKSHLAHEYAMKYRLEYRMICWIDCTTPESLIHGIERLIDTLQLRDYLDGQPTTAKMEVLARALNNTENSWLLIMDNCTSETIDNIVNFLPRNHGDVIFTTNDDLVRHQLCDDTGRIGKPGPYRMFLDDLSAEESINLLLHGLPEEEASRELLPAAQIVKRIRGHPLALRVVRFLSKSFRATSSYEEALFRIEYMAGPRNPLQTNLGSLSVHGTIRMSLSRMSLTARWVLAVISCFHNNNIPEFLINSLPATSVHLAIAAADGPDILQLGGLSDANQVDDGLRENERRGMIRRHVVKRGKVVFSTHPVVSHTAKAFHVFHDPKRRALRLAVGLSNAALPNYDEGYLKLRDWQDGEELLPHAAALESLSREMDFPVEGSLEVLYKIACRKYLWAGDQKGAEEIATAVLGNLDGPLHRRTDSEFAFAILLSRMIATYCLQVRAENELLRPWEAKFISIVLRESIRRFGKSDSRTVKLKSYLAAALSANNPDQPNLSHALELLQEVVKDMEKIYGTSDTQTLRAYAQLALSKAWHQWDDLGAKELSVVEARLKHILPKTRQKEPHLHYLISRIYEERKNFVKMKEYAIFSLESLRKLVSPSHPHLGWHVLYFIKSLRLLEQWDELARFLQQEPLLERFSGPYFEMWTRKVEHFVEVYTTDFFNGAVLTNGYIHEIVEYADFRTYWQVEVISRDLNLKAPPDPMYEVAVMLDDKNWEYAENLIKNFLSYAPDQEVTQPKMLTEQREAKQAVHGLIWAILWQACGCPEELLSSTTDMTAIFDQGTSYRELEQRFVRFWDRIWHQIDSVPCGISIDTDWLPDRYFSIPLLFAPYILRVVVLGSVEATKLVLKRRPNVHIKNSEGKTAFYYAAEYHHFEILNLLLQATTEKPQFYFGETSLLHLLCVETWQARQDAEDDQVDAVVELLRRGHKPDFVNGEGRTPLNLAEQHGLREIARELKNYRQNYG